MSAPASSLLNMPTQSTSAALRRVFNSPPIFNTLFAHCMGTTSPARLSRVHPGAQLAFHDYSTRTWHKRLLRYFPDPCAFRSFQARTGFLVSGSQPLQVFTGDDYGPTSDLDLYPWPGTERLLGNWIIAQGYSYVDGAPVKRPFNAVMNLVAQEGWGHAWADADELDLYRGCPEVDGVLCFVKDTVGPTGEHCALHVQIVVSKVSPVATILNFHSTPVINLVSWDRAYCLFPRTTCDEHRMVILRGYANIAWQDTQKYNDRGFSDSWHSFPADAPAALTKVDGKYEMQRWIGDRFTWTIDLRTDGVTPPPRPEVDLTLNGFSVVLHDPDTRTYTFLEVSGDFSSDSGSDSEMSTDSDDDSPEVVTIVHQTAEQHWGLTVPYIVPDGFTDKILALTKESGLFSPTQCYIFFDPADNTGPDGRMRQAKYAYERERNGDLRTRLALRT